MIEGWVKAKWHKFSNKANPKVATDLNKSKGFIKYGKDNDFPNVLIDKIDDSPTGQACLSTFIDFIEGDGLSDENISNVVANAKGQTFADITSSLCTDTGYFEGVYLLVKYNLEFKISEVCTLPFEACRLGFQDENTRDITHIVYNKFFGTKDYKQDQDINYPLFDPRPEVVKGQIETFDKDGITTFKGQIYFSKLPKPGKHDYPIPDYNAGIEWFEIDAKIGNFHLKNISNNFLLSCILKIIGDPNKKSSDNDKTNSELLTEELNENLKGDENAGDMMVLWAPNKDSFPSIEAFPNSTNHDLFIALENIVIDRIARVTKVPPILANIQVSGKLGNTEEILNSIYLLHHRVNKRQRFIERILTKILTNWHEPVTGEVSIKNLNPINHIPDNLLDVLTIQEKRDLVETFTGQKLNPVEAAPNAA